MRGSGCGGRPLACRSSGWPGRDWLGRHCRRARLHLERALRQARPSRLISGSGFGAGVVMASAVAGGAAAAGEGPPAPDGSGSSQQQQKRSKSLSDLGHPARRATDVLLALNAVAYLLNWLSRDTLLLLGCKVNSLIAAGQLWRLLTPLFLHSNPVHLLVNMHALHTLGPKVEVVSGSKRTAVIYIASGVAATLASFLLCPLPSLGASGAVFGLGSALGVFYWRHREVLGPASESGLRSLGLAAAINVAYSMINKRIDNFGHAGGLIGGAVLAYLLGPRFVATVGEGGARGLQDLPPIRWLAFKTPGASGSGSELPPRLQQRLSTRPAAPEQQQKQQQPGSARSREDAAAAGSG